MILITDDMKTEWYPPEVKPVHSGVYEISYSPKSSNKALHGFAHFDGELWGWKQETAERAEKFPVRRVDNIQNKHWRGLKAPHDGETS